MPTDHTLFFFFQNLNPKRTYKFVWPNTSQDYGQSVHIALYSRFT